MYSKQKGKQFEEKIAQIIQKYCQKHFPNLETNLANLQVRRSPFSGIAQYELGDIELGIYRLVLPKLVIECKKWKQLNFNNSLFSVLKTLEKLYISYKEQYNKKLTETKIDLVLVFSANYGKIYCFTELDFDNIDNIRYKQFMVYEFEEFINMYIRKTKENNTLICG